MGVGIEMTYTYGPFSIKCCGFKYSFSIEAPNNEEGANAVKAALNRFTEILNSLPTDADRKRFLEDRKEGLGIKPIDPVMGDLGLPVKTFTLEEFNAKVENYYAPNMVPSR